MVFGGDPFCFALPISNTHTHILILPHMQLIDYYYSIRTDNKTISAYTPTTIHIYICK